jgi:hypothetical protein
MKETIISVLSFLLVACTAEWQEETIEGIRIIPVNPDKASKEVLYSEVFDRIDYVRIPTDDDFLIGELNKLMVSGDCFFVMDNQIAHSVFGFDKDGNKTVQIAKRGPGPGEYIDMRDICYDPEKKEIGVLCYMRRRIFYYGMNGKLLREKPIPVTVALAQPLSEDHYALCCKYTPNNRLKQRGLYANLLIGSPGKMQIESTAHYFPVHNPSLVSTSGNCFSRFGDTLSIKPDHSDIVYHFGGNEIYPAYKLDFGPKNASERYWKKVAETGMTFERLNSYLEDSKFCESSNFYESDNYLYFSYKIGHSAVKVLYSKNTQKMLHTENFVNDMDSVTTFRPLAMEGNKLYCIIEAEDIVEKKNASMLGRSFPKSLSDSIDEFDNPIVAIFTLKDF